MVEERAIREHEGEFVLALGKNVRDARRCIVYGGFLYSMRIDSERVTLERISAFGFDRLAGGLNLFFQEEEALRYLAERKPTAEDRIEFSLEVAGNLS